MEMVPYDSAIGILMYVLVCTRQIEHMLLVRRVAILKLGREHWQVVKSILRYLRGMSKACLYYGSDKSLLVGYTNAYMVSELVTKKSTSGLVITFAGGAMSWLSKLHKCVALSTTEAKFIDTTEAYKDMLWGQDVLE